MHDLESHPLLISLLEGDLGEQSGSVIDQDALEAHVGRAKNPITKGQSENQMKAIFTGHEGLDESTRASVPLHGQNNANTGIISEKPIHRAMAFMMAQGMNQTEIAERCGYSMGQVSQIARQLWFKQLVTAEVEAAGRDEVMTLLQGSTVDSIRKLIELRDNAKSEQVQFNSASALIDRVMGKAPQHIVQDVNLTSNDPQAEMEALQRELAVLAPKTQQNN